MKRILILLLIISSCLVSCSNEPEGEGYDILDPGDILRQPNKPITEETDITEITTIQNNIITDIQETVSNDNIVSKTTSDKSSYYAIINDTKYSTGTPLRDLLNAGFSFEGERESNMLSPKMSTLDSLLYEESENGSLNVTIYNPFNFEEDMSRLYIGGMKLSAEWVKELNLNVNFVGGITFDSSEDDIIQVFGKCPNISELDNYGDDILWCYKSNDGQVWYNFYFTEGKLSVIEWVYIVQEMG